MYDDMSHVCNIQEQCAHFGALLYETKKQKVLRMVESLRSTHTVFANLYTKLYTQNGILEETLVLVYR